MTHHHIATCLAFLGFATTLAGMEIRDSARKHGVRDIDMLHALRHYLYTIEEDDLTIRIVPASNGQLLEIGISIITGNLVHDMTARPKYLIYKR